VWKGKTPREVASLADDVAWIKANLPLDRLFIDVD
jgi:hypothetical protein